MQIDLVKVSNALRVVQKLEQLKGPLEEVLDMLNGLETTSKRRKQAPPQYLEEIPSDTIKIRGFSNYLYSPSLDRIISLVMLHRGRGKPRVLTWSKAGWVKMDGLDFQKEALVDDIMKGRTPRRDR